ncbi:MAG TPA: hemolysin family protein, partial [Polyangia bacterium]
GVLVAANAFFVASEFAIVKVRSSRVRELVKQGGTRATVLSGVLNRLDAYLSANQLGITLASLALGWIGEPTLAPLLEPMLAGLGESSGVAARTLAFTISFVVVTFLHTTLGEQVPKVLALQRAEPVALWTAVPLRVFYILAFPLIWTLNTAANLVLKILGLDPKTEAEMLHSPNELRLVLQHVKLDPGARRLIDRVFDYTHRVARHVMTLRRDVVVLTAGLPFEENLKVALANQYTRYPLVDPNTDAVVGYVHLKDIVAALASARPPKRMREICRQPIYVSEETRLEWLRREFQRRRVHIAVVLGAGDRFVGIVTMEDLLEEFLGEIQDEQDIGEVPPVVRSADGRFEADGRLTLDVAARDLGLALTAPSPTIETLGAYLEAALGRPPMPGDVIEVGGFRLVAGEIRDGHVRRVRGEPLPTHVEVDVDDTREGSLELEGRGATEATDPRAAQTNRNEPGRS